MLDLALTVEDVDPQDLCAVINEDRMASGFSEVEDVSLVEAELQERRRYYRQVMMSALDALPSRDLLTAVTDLVDCATDKGQDHGPILVSDLVDAYEAKVQGPLAKHQREVERFADELRAAAAAKQPSAALAALANRLSQAVKSWDAIAQPIQVSMKGRGVSHDPSHQVARMVRDLAVHLFNEHGMLGLSQQLTGLLRGVFAEVGEVAERTAEDASTLAGIAERRAQEAAATRKREEEWRRAITYEAEIGLFLKDRLSISPAGVEWRGTRWELQSISRIRWGATRIMVNGFHRRTDYTILVGSKAAWDRIEPKEESVYTTFVGCLWKAVGVRLLTEYLNGLKDGKRYPFGSALICDRGVEFERWRLFAKNERVFCRWDGVRIWCSAGHFHIGSTTDENLGTGLSYIEEDNVHVVEAALRMFLEKPGRERLSSLLEG
jgi:hypothetical protein